MPADEFRGGMHDNIRTMFDRTDQVGCSEGIVDHQRDPVFMCDRRNRVNIGDIRIRVAQGFQIDRFGIRTDRRFHFFKVMRVHKGGADPVRLQCMCEQVVAAAVNRFLRYDVIPCRTQRQHCVRDRGCTGADSKRIHTAFQRSDPFFQDLLCRIGKTSVNMSALGKFKPGCRLRAVFKNIGCRLIDRNGPGVRGGIRLFLSDMELHCFKSVLCHKVCFSPFRKISVPVPITPGGGYEA